MNSRTEIRRFVLSVIVGAGCAIGIQAQEFWMPIGPPNITNSIVQTVGGITYFTYTSLIAEGCCVQIRSGEVSRSGTNLSQTISEGKYYDNCVDMLCDPFAETHVSVLGELPAGAYTLTLSTLSTISPGPWTSIFGYVSVSVPESEIPTILPLQATNAVSFLVYGIPNVNYIIESSSSLTNWAPVHTNMGGPFVWSEPIAPEILQRYYRVHIIGE